jgi:hypothetical protein
MGLARQVRGGRPEQCLTIRGEGEKGRWRVEEPEEARGRKLGGLLEWRSLKDRPEVPSAT